MDNTTATPRHEDKKGQRDLSAEAQAIKEILQELKQGVEEEKLKERFDKVFGDKPVSAISEAEQELMAQGMDSCELSGLCGIHHASMKDAHEQKGVETPVFYPPHPLAYLELDGQKVMEFFREQVRPVVHGAQPLEYLAERLKAFYRCVEKHFALKENVLFSYLDKKGISGPTRVMWAADDEIRSKIKAAIELIEKEPANVSGLVSIMHPTMSSLGDMMSREKEVLIPLLAENLNPVELAEAALSMKELGYNFENARLWVPELAQDRLSDIRETMRSSIAGELQKPQVQMPQVDRTERQLIESSVQQAVGGHGIQIRSELTFPTGVLNTSELLSILNTLGLELSFVACDNTLHYYSQAESMHFIRTRANLGNDVFACHPQRSHQAVKETLEALESGKAKIVSRIAKKGDKEFLVEYRALHDEQGNYLGCLETVLDLDEQADKIRRIQEKGVAYS